MTTNDELTHADVNLSPGSMRATRDVAPGDTILLLVPPTLIGLEASIDLEGLVQIRFPLSIGRGQRLRGVEVNVEISHFATPHRVRCDLAQEVPATFTRGVVISPRTLTFRSDQGTTDRLERGA